MTGSETPADLPTAVFDGARRFDGSAVHFASTVDPVATTLGQLVMDAERVAGALQGQGIGSGDVVAVQAPNRYDGTVVQVAAILTGAVVLPIVPIYGPAEVTFILRQSGASAFVVPRTWRGRDLIAMAASLPGLPALRTVVVLGDGPAPDGMLAYPALVGPLARPYVRPTLAPTDRAALVYTSGTTAEPKGVQHAHTSLLAEVHSGLMHSDPAAARHLALFPAGHIAGLLGLLRVLVLGTPTIVLDTWDAEHAARLADEHRVTSGVGAPVQLASLLDVRDRGGADLTSLTEFMTGAAGVPPTLIERADTAGMSAYRSYGSSEHPTISSGATHDLLVKRSSTDGRIIPGNAVRLVDDAGNDVPEGTDGEIASRGTELFMGYTDPARDREAFLPEGWFRTGDVGRLDLDGYLTITDRKKDVIIRGGENISSKEVEDILARLPQVIEAAAVGVPDSRLGERVCAFLVTRGDVAVDVAEIRAHFAAAGVARQKTPERVVVVSELPRTAAGKVQKFRLREGLAEEAPRAG